ncbi:MAG: DNA topoisomerase VI subunit B [Candidatus Diapherotrites archaeon]|nr:DNA topoisomerase VI subunit B [Candidatus Diapherotrites archaeon]
MAKEQQIDITTTAEALAKEFKEHSVAEFFKKNRQMLGLYGKIRSLTTIIHEYVTNSLDACEEANILPEIEIKIDELGPEYYEVTVKDNGPGLTKEVVGKAFGQLLAGTKFHRLMQMRGQQGIGAAGCTMFSQMTTGKPVKVISGTGNGKCFAVEISIDAKTNQPKLSNYKEFKRNFRGVAVRAKFKEVLYKESEQSPLEYIRRTAIANPHVTIKFTDPSGKKHIFKRTSNKIPKKPKAVKPHPKGVTVDDVLSYARSTKAQKVISFLKNDFDRMGAKALEEISKKVNFDLNKDPRSLTWEEAEQIVKAFRETDFLAPSTDTLSPIGEEQIKKSFQTIVKPEFLSVVSRKPKVYAGGFAFQVEVGIGVGGEAGRTLANGEKKAEIMRFANKVPLLFDAGSCAITKAVQSVDWKRYGLKDFENSPVTVFVSLVSVYVPYTGAGKQAVADIDEIVEEIKLALMDSGRRTSRYLAALRKEREKQMRREAFMKYIPEVSSALAKITKVKEDKLKKKLEKLVLDKLKLEELEEKIEKARAEARGKEVKSNAKESN